MESGGMTLTAKWLSRILYRLAGLAPGRYVVMLEVTDDDAHWLIAKAGDWENGKVADA